MTILDKFIFSEKTETGFSKPEFFYDYEPNKIVLVTGRTLSGKEDLMYTIIRSIRGETINTKYIDLPLKYYNSYILKSIFPNIKNTKYNIHEVDATLKIIVALWIKSIHKNILIEYPENNLHPSEQADLVDCICEKSSERSGVILIYTNSDYIINGVLRNIKNGVIKNTDVDILYAGSAEELGICVEEENKSKPVIVKCLIKDTGRIKAFDGFFDQYNKDMNNLL